MKTMKCFFIFAILFVCLYAVVNGLNGGARVRHTRAMRSTCELTMVPQQQQQPPPAEQMPSRTFASYIVYKGRCAVSIKAIPPTMVPLSSTSKSRVVERAGGLFIEMALAVSGKEREYDWTRKGTFLLDPTECAEVLVMDKSGCEFFHDPFMGDTSGKAGTIAKKMKWAPSPDNRGLFLSLQVTDKSSNSAPNSSGGGAAAAGGGGGGGQYWAVPVSWAELEVIRSIIRYSIPYFLGFDQVWQNGGLGQQGEFAPTPPNAPLWSKMNN